MKYIVSVERLLIYYCTLEAWRWNLFGRSDKIHIKCLPVFCFNFKFKFM